MVQEVNAENFEHNVIIAALLVLLFFVSNFTINKVFKKYMQIKFEKEVSDKKREAEKKYKELFENAANIIFIVTRDDYKIKSYNNCFVQELELNTDNISQTSFLDLLSTENQEIFKENYKRALRGASAAYELCIQNDKWGKPKVFSITNTIVKDDAAPDSIQCIGTDITPQKELADELSRTRNKLQSVFDGLKMGISLITSDFEVAMVNKYQAHLFNKQPNELIGNKCYNVYRGHSAVCNNCPATVTLEKQTPNNHEMRIIARSGKEKYYDLFTQPVRNAKNEVYGFISLVRDVTGTKLLELKALRKNKELALLGAIPEIINEDTDLTGVLDSSLKVIVKFLELKGGIVLLFDEEKKKIELRAVYDLFERFSNKIIELWGAEEIINEFIKSKASVAVDDVDKRAAISFELKTLCASSGIDRFILVPIKVREKMYGAIFLVGTSAREKTGYDLKLLDTVGSELGAAVMNRYLDDKLAKASKSLEKSEETAIEKDRLIAESELAGSSAHELKQPLTTIMSYSEFLMNDTKEDSNIYQTLKIITEEADRMLSIVNKIELLTRYETSTHLKNTKIINIRRPQKDE